MQKLINLIEQVRLAELDKIAKLSKSQEAYMSQNYQFNQENTN